MNNYERERECSMCIFGDKCQSNVCFCEYYSSVIEDENIDELIEDRRNEFTKDWLQYISTCTYF